MSLAAYFGPFAGRCESWVSSSLKVLASMGTIFSAPSIKACPAEGSLSDGYALSGRVASSSALSLKPTLLDLSTGPAGMPFNAKKSCAPGEVRLQFNYRQRKGSDIMG
jgi:hypothetical protein